MEQAIQEGEEGTGEGGEEATGEQVICSAVVLVATSGGEGDLLVVVGMMRTMRMTKTKRKKRKMITWKKMSILSR